MDCNQAKTETAYNPEKAKAKAALYSILSNSLLVMAKLAVGVLSGSVAIISEAIHSGLDLVAALMAFIAIKVSNTPADYGHPFGHGKAESIASLFEALLIIGAGLLIIKKSVDFFLNPRDINLTGLAILVMLLSVLVNWLISSYLFKVGKHTESAALIGDAWHLRTDVYTSGGILLSLLIIWVGSFIRPDLNLDLLDPVCAVLVALLILKTGFSLSYEAIGDLLDVSLPEKELELIKNRITAQEPVIRGFTDLRARKAGSTRFVEFTILVEAVLSVGEAHDVADEITADIVAVYPRAQVVIHIEPCDP